MSKSSYTPEFRAKIAQEYLNGNCSRKDLSKKYNIPESMHMLKSRLAMMEVKVQRLQKISWDGFLVHQVKPKQL